MKVKIFGSPENTTELENKVRACLDELGLVDFIKVEITSDEELKTELDIQKEPALIIEEESIDFKDTIFEGIIPEEDEIKSMFISIIGGSGGSCGSKEDDGSCGTGCAC
ncbi:MAG: hypothetical protein GY828_06835 [Candidatus Gracilibacteria bacterium]|nr:hypothetical protein [Candidatus Gracilibacteria bacterium]